MYNYLVSHKKTLVYTPLCIYWFILLVLTSIPSKSLPSVGIWDKYEHFLGYFGLGFLLNLTMVVQNKFPLLKKHPVLFTIAAGTFYGMLDELHQLFIPGRSCDILDWTADVIGITLGITAVFIISQIVNKMAKHASRKSAN